MVELLSYQKYLLLEIGLFTLNCTLLLQLFAIAEGAGVTADVKKLLLMLLFSFN
jgi:hypothetical protein